MRFFDSILNMD